MQPRFLCPWIKEEGKLEPLPSVDETLKEFEELMKKGDKKNGSE